MAREGQEYPCYQHDNMMMTQRFSHQRKLMVLHWRLSDSKSPQVSRTLLSILAVFNNAVVWMVSTRPLTSISSRPFNNPLVTLPKATITIGIIFTFIFPCKVEILISLFTFFQFYSVVSQDSKVNNFSDFLLLLLLLLLLLILLWEFLPPAFDDGFPLKSKW